MLVGLFVHYFYHMALDLNPWQVVMQQSRCQCLIASHPKDLYPLWSGGDGWASNISIDKEHSLPCCQGLNHPDQSKDHRLVPGTGILQQAGLRPGIPRRLCYQLMKGLLLTWCCCHVDGQGWFCPLPQSERAWRGLLLLLPPWAGWLGAGWRSLVSFSDIFRTTFF